MLAPLGTSATHNIGGEIRYHHVEGFTYAFDVHLYTRLIPFSYPSQIMIDFGGGSTYATITDSLEFLSDPCSDARLSIYSASHTFAGPGVYVVSVENQNRNGGIINIPNSMDQPLCIEATLIISPALGANTSIQFDTALVATHRAWYTLVHNPGAFDADGDSMSFELVSPMGLGCQPIIGYQIPWATNFTWLDPTNGTFLWYHPDIIGEWTIAIRGSEWRNGQLIGQVTRDMTICVLPFEVGVPQDPSPTELETSPSVAEDHIWITNPTPSPLALEVLSATGMVVVRTRVVAGREPVDVAGLASGAYWVRTVDVVGGVRSARFVKP